MRRGSPQIASDFVVARWSGTFLRSLPLSHAGLSSDGSYRRDLKLPRLRESPQESSAVRDQVPPHPHRQRAPDPHRGVRTPLPRPPLRSEEAGRSEAQARPSLITTIAAFGATPRL